MSTTEHAVRLFVNSGREAGWMVVGSREALIELGQKLQAAASAPLPVDDGVPSDLVLCPRVVSPYSDSEEFFLSFHIEGLSPAQEHFKLIRRSTSLTWFLGIAGLCFIGAYAIVTWITGLFR